MALSYQMRADGAWLGFRRGSDQRVFGRGQFYARKKSIPSLRQRFDKARIIGVVTQGFAQPVHCPVQAAIIVHNCIRGPKALLKFFACEDLEWALDECD